MIFILVGVLLSLWWAVGPLEPAELAHSQARPAIEPHRTAMKRTATRRGARGWISGMPQMMEVLRCG